MIIKVKRSLQKIKVIRAVDKASTGNFASEQSVSEQKCKNLA